MTITEYYEYGSVSFTIGDYRIRYKYHVISVNDWVTLKFPDGSTLPFNRGYVYRLFTGTEKTLINPRRNWSQAQREARYLSANPAPFERNSLWQVIGQIPILRKLMSFWTQ